MKILNIICFLGSIDGDGWIRMIELRDKQAGPTEVGEASELRAISCVNISYDSLL